VRKRETTPQLRLAVTTAALPHPPLGLG
jgi:hypothetical protein